MIEVLQILAILVVAVLLATTLGHALEMPGKMRLDRDAYFATQTIYWPGFTVIGGGAEVFSVLATLALTVLTPMGSPNFWLVFGAFALAAALHAVYWVFIHPVNKVWVEHIDLKGGGVRSGGRRFFAAGASGTLPTDWKGLRDRWEYSHAVRAGMNLAALALLATAAVREG
jgi:hypothetical protein